MKFLIKLLGVILFVFAFSCNDVSIRKGRIFTDIDSFQIQFPSQVKLINDYNADSTFFYSGIPKIIHWFSGDCSICVEELKSYQKLIEELQQDINVDPIFFVSTSNYHLLDYMLENNGINIPIFYDVNDEFFSINTLDQNKEYHSFILSSNNRVIYSGNPVINSRMRKEFIYILSSLEENQKY